MSLAIRPWSFDERSAFERDHGGLLDRLWAAWFGPRVQVQVVTDLAAQRAGLDATVRLPSMRADDEPWTAQEKIRDKDYGDILLELVSNDRTGAPGWTRTLSADLVLYAVAATKRAVLLPGLALKRAFAAHANEWVKTYGVKRAPNPGYTTVNVAVPTGFLAAAIDGAHGEYACSRCGSVGRRWSNARGGDAIVACLPNGPSPWGIRL